MLHKTREDSTGVNLEVHENILGSCTDLMKVRLTILGLEGVVMDDCVVCHWYFKLGLVHVYYIMYMYVSISLFCVLLIFRYWKVISLIYVYTSDLFPSLCLTGCESPGGKISRFTERNCVFWQGKLSLYLYLLSSIFTLIQGQLLFTFLDISLIEYFPLSLRNLLHIYIYLRRLTYQLYRFALICFTSAHCNKHQS